MITNKELLSILRRFPKDATIKLVIDNKTYDEVVVRAQMDEQSKWQIIFEASHSSTSETKN